MALVLDHPGSVPGEIIADKFRHLIMIPVRECKHELITVLASIWGVRIMDSERAAQSVRHLPTMVSMSPGSARLIYLPPGRRGRSMTFNLPYSEVIGKRRLRWYWALSCSRRPKFNPLQTDVPIIGPAAMDELYNPGGVQECHATKTSSEPLPRGSYPTAMIGS
jgi:hypothetical protein